MWTATITRPDISCAVRAVVRFFENPGSAHKKVVMKILQYLLHTKEWGITYGGQSCGICMEAYTNSDFGACLDTRQSVSGAVLMLAKGAISWHSRMQEVTASGTSEAEYVALLEVVKEVSIFEIGARAHGTIDEGRCSECVRRAGRKQAC